MPPSHDDLYRAFLDWSASIGCPQPDPSLFRNLHRGNGAHFLRLLVNYVRPLNTVSHVQNTLRLHAASNTDKSVAEQNVNNDNKDNEKLCFLRKSHAATIKEIEYLNQKQSQIRQSIRALSNSVVSLEHACRRNTQEVLEPIQNLTESVKSISMPICGSEKQSVISMGESGHLEASDPVRYTLQTLYDSLVNDPTKTAAISLPFAPDAKLVDSVVQISRDHLSLLHQTISLPETVNPVKSEMPVSLSQLMQDSRDAHNDRFFDALEQLNLARDLRDRCEGPAAPELLIRQVRLRARLDCLNHHIKRCEDSLTQAQADYQHLRDSLDAISKLDAEREKLHQQLAAIIRANRDLRSQLNQKQTECRSNETVIRSAIKSVSERLARLTNCFEIEANTILHQAQSEPSPISHSDEAYWQTVAENLRFNGCESCHPVSILFKVRSWFEKLSALKVSNAVGLMLLASAKRIQCCDVEGLKARCKELHESSEQTTTDFNSTLELLQRLDQESDKYRDCLRNWWEQPAQYTVPEEQRLGLNITGWIDRRRKLLAELHRDLGRRAGPP